MLVWEAMPCCLLSGACSQYLVLLLLLDCRQVSLAQPSDVLTLALAPA